MAIILISDNKIYLEHWSNAITDAKICNSLNIDEISFYDIVILDYNILDAFNDFIALLKLLYDKHVKVIVLDNKPSFIKSQKLLKYKVSAYGNVLMNKVHICSAVQSVQDGQIWLYPDFISQMVTMIDNGIESTDDKLSILTNREKEIAKLILKGFSNKDIASHLSISSNTVKVHISKIFDKFEVNDRFAFTIKLK